MLRLAVFFYILLVCATSTATAQTAQDSIKHTINRLFAAMNKADSAALVACFAPDAVLQSIVTQDGRVTVRNETALNFGAAVAGMQPGDADEQVDYETIKMDDNLALVWGSYRFYWKGQLSHCGVDSIQLVRIDGEWKIVYVIDTRRKEGCQ